MDINDNEKKSINELYGIILGIDADGIINSQEISFLQEWLISNKNYENNTVLKDVYKFLKEKLEDNRLTQIDKKNLLEMCRSIEEQLKSKKNSFLKLLGIIQGISCDKKINEYELNSLNKWLDENHILQGNLIFNKILDTVKEILEDGVISSQEEKDLLDLFDTIIISKREYMTITYIR